MAILDLADEYWPASELIKAALAPHAEKLRRPLKVQPMAVEIENLDRYIGVHSKAKAREIFGLPKDKAIYLCTFDPRSTLARKNPQAVITAFTEAFKGGSDKVLLVVKALKPSRTTKELQEMYDLIESDNRIRLIEDDLDRRELLMLYSGCDCLVSLHRSEGYGRNIFEARIMGLKIIATGYGGFTDQPWPSSEYHVDYNMTTISECHYNFAAGHQWAEPVLNAAIDHLQKSFLRISTKTTCYSGIQLASSNSMSALASLHNTCSAAVIGRSYRARIESILNATSLQRDS